MNVPSSDLGPPDPRLRRLLRAEAYRVPVRLSGAQLAARAAAAGPGGRPWLQPIRLAKGAAVALLAVGIGLSGAAIIGRGPTGGTVRPSPPACDAARATVHGSWWSEVGGPHAFFNIEPGTRLSTGEGETWLLHVRIDPDAGPAEELTLWAEDMSNGDRVDGVLNGPADPANIFRFDVPAPTLPGGWYLFEQRIPAPGCWRLHAAIDHVEVGSAIVVVGDGGAGPSSIPSGPQPTTISRPSD